MPMTYRMVTGMNRAIIIALVAPLLAAMATALSPGLAGAQQEYGPDAVYIPQTGHALRDDFLSHWRQQGGLPIFGYPLTEAVADPATGVVRQYFERAVFDANPNGDGVWSILLHRLGADLSAGRLHEKPFRPRAQADNPDCDWYVETGHFLCNAFRDYWNAWGGLPTFGFPVSEEFQERSRDTGEVYTVQYFERARFEWHPEYAGTVYEVLFGRLGADAATRALVDTAAIAKPADIVEYAPDLWNAPATPEEEPALPPVNVPVGAPVGETNWIEVDLSEQYMTAWEYDERVLGTLVSTGTWNNPTPTGTFTVFWKLRYDDMTNGPSAPPEEYYYVEDVPHVMYFAAGGYAIHGAYWHNMFGTPYSHGCVSTPLWAAEWFYNWAPYGTIVWIHE